MQLSLVNFKFLEKAKIITKHSERQMKTLQTFQINNNNSIGSKFSFEILTILDQY